MHDLMIIMMQTSLNSLFYRVINEIVCLDILCLVFHLVCWIIPACSEQVYQ